MKRKKKTIFDGIHKPTAPPTKKFKNKKKEDKSDLVGRKDKHKDKETYENNLFE